MARLIILGRFNGKPSLIEIHELPFQQQSFGHPKSCFAKDADIATDNVVLLQNRPYEPPFFFQIHDTKRLLILRDAAVSRHGMNLDNTFGFLERR